MMYPCPDCGKELDTSPDTVLNEPYVPQEGDIMLCPQCGYLMAFSHDLTIRELTEKEAREAVLDPLVRAALQARKEALS